MHGAAAPLVHSSYLDATGSAPPKPTLASLRSQAAVVRALLEEFERLVPSPERAPLAESQLADELLRLGLGVIQAARQLRRERR